MKKFCLPFHSNYALGFKKIQKALLISTLLILQCCIGIGQTTVNYIEQTGYYTAGTVFTSGTSGVFNQNAFQMGMYSHGTSPQVVAWRQFQTNGTNSGSARSLKVGDVFTITLSATRAFGQMGFALLASPSSHSNYNDGFNNAGICFNNDNYGAWYAKFGNGSGSLSATSTGSNLLYGSQGTFKTFTFVITITAPDRVNATINDGTTTSFFYDLLMNTSNPITEYSVYLSNDWDGGANQNIYWNASNSSNLDKVTNNGALPIGSSNTSFTESNSIQDGYAANSTSTLSPNTLTKSGTGILTLSGLNTFSGGINLNGGTLRVGSTSNQPLNYNNLNMGGGTLDCYGWNATIGTLSGTSGSVTIGGAYLSTLTLQSNSNSSYSGTILNGSGTLSLSKTGTGIQTLGGTNTYSGGTTISGGAISVSADANLGATTSGLTLSGGTLGFTSGFTLNSNRATTLTSLTTSAIDVASGITNYYGGVISGSGNITKTGAGYLSLSGNNTFTGTTTISNGTLYLGASGTSPNSPLGTTSGNTIISSGASLDVSGYSLATAEPLTINGSGYNTFGAVTNSSLTAATYSGPITLASNASVYSSFGALTLSGGVTTAGYQLTLDGTVGGLLTTSAITGTGSLYKTNTGTWTLSAANSYSGLTTINNGTLFLGSAGSGSNSPLGTIASSTVVNSGGALDVYGYSLATAEPLTINGTGSSVIAAGALTNSSATSATYSGLITLGSAATITSNFGALTISNTGTITGAGYALTLNGTTGGSIASIIGTGSGTLTKSGTGTWTLSGANTYTGTTSVTAGTLNITGSLASGSAVTVSSGATLSGTGTVNGTVSVSGVISPNSSGSIGTLTSGNLTLGAGGTYYVDINNIPSGGTAGTNWDKLIAGTITNSATSGSNFIVSLNGTIAGFVSSTPYTWTIGTYTGSAPSTSNIAISNNLTNSLAGVFSIAFSSGNISLVYTPTPTITVGAITAFGGVCVNATSSPNTFTVSGANLIGNLTLTPPAGYQISLSSGSGYTTGALSLTPSGGSVSNTTIYVQFIPSSATTYTGNITATSSGAVSQNVAVSGTGSPLPTAATISGAATICNGSSTNLSVAITGGSSPYTVIYTGGAGGTVNSYTSGSSISVSPASTTTYGLTSVSDANGCAVVAPSGSPVVTVVAQPVAGTVSATSNAICSGETTAVSLSGSTGNIQWQSSSDNSSWSSVSGGSGATTTSYTTAALTAGLYYRAAVSNAACSAVNSNAVLVAVNESVAGSSLNNGDNDNTSGFGAWSLASVSSFSGFFIVASSTSIDVNSKSWGLWANSSNTASAVRPLSSVMSVGQTINFSIANTTVPAGSSVGFSLYNSTGATLMEFYFVGGSTYYTIHDNSGTPATTIPYTTSGINIGLVYTSATTYALEVTVGTSIYNYTGTLITQTPQAPGKIRIYNYNVSGSSINFYANGLSLNNPVVTSHPSSTIQNVFVGGSPTALSITSYGTGLSHQWYSNTSNSNSGGTLIVGATSTSYTPPATSAGTTYYYCVVSGTCASTSTKVSGAVVVANNPPVITSFSTADNNGTTTSGYVGTTVTITGTYLGSATALTVGGTSVFNKIITNTSTSITFTSIAGINGTISVTTNGGLGISSSSYADLGYISKASTDWNTASTWLGNAVPSANESVLIAHAVTVTGTVSNAASTITINSSKSLTLSSSAILTATTVVNNGALSISAGTLTIANAGALTNNTSGTSFSGGTVSFSGTATVDGTYAITFNNLTLGGGATLTTIPTITGTLTLNSGAYVTASPIYSGNTTLNYNTAGGVGAKYNQSNEWPTSNGPTNVSITNGTWVQLTRNSSLTGNLTVTNGALQATGGSLKVLTMNGTTQTITISTASGGAIYGTDNGFGNDMQLTVANGSTTTLTGDATTTGDDEKKFYNINVISGGTLVLNKGILCKYGSFTVAGTLQINSNGYVQSASGVAANYSSGNLIYSNGGPYTATVYEWPTTNAPTNVTIQSTSTNVTLNGTKVIAGTLTLTNGKITLGANTLTLSGTIARTSGVIDASDVSATVVFTNASALTLPSGLFTGNVNNLTINGTGGVTLGSATTVAGTLTLTVGKLILENNNLTVASISGGSSSSYIITNGTGTVTKNSISVSQLLPIGTANYYAPLQFATSSSNNITVAVSGSFTHAPAVVANTVGLQWSILASGAYTSNITFQYNAANQGSGYSSSGAILGTYSGGIYDESALGTFTGSGPYTVTASSLLVPTGSASLYGIGNPYSFLQTVPDAPSIGTVTRGNQQVSVAFTAPVDNGGSAITEYTVTSNPSNITTTGVSSPLIVTGLTNGTAYTFTVTATNSVGTSASSSASSSVTPATVPNAPASVTPTADNTQVYIAYTAPSSNGGNAVIDYTITAIPSSGSNIIRTGITDNPYAFTGLSNGVAYTFSIAARNSIGTGATTTSIAATPSSTTIWNGTTWSAGAPDSSQIAILAANYTSASPIVCTKLTVNSGVTFFNNSTITVTNSPITINGTISGGVLILNGSSAQSIAGNGVVGSLTVNNASGVSVAGVLGITGVLNLQSGSFTTNGNVILKSNSIASSGILGPIGVNGNNGSISGNITVERYIPKGFRAYRDLSANGVYNPANTIFNTWQESGSYSNSGYGMFITGTLDTTVKHNLVDPTTGIDHSLTGYASAYYYKAGWNTISNTKTTALNPYQSYRALVRGDRSFDLDTTPVVMVTGPTQLAMHNATTLRATGTPITGNVTFSTTGITNAITGATYNSGSFGLNSAVNGYTYLANPYPCPIVFDSIYSNSSNIKASYYYLDPTIGSTGAYVSYNAASGLASNGATSAKYIQAGQGFLIGNNNSSSPVVELKESYKATGANVRTSVFGNGNNSSMSLTLWYKYNSVYYNAGGNATVAFDSSFSNAFWAGDNTQFPNANDNLSLVSTDGVALGVYARKTATIHDTIPILLGQLSTTDYELKIDATSYIGNGLTPYIYDNYLKKTTELKIGIDSVPFTADNAKPITYQNRFSIIFKSSTLPIKNITASVILKNGNAEVSWTSIGESALSTYQVEKSTDGKNFTTIGNVAASNAIYYNLIDKSMGSPTTYYRVKFITVDGIVAYSNVVLINTQHSCISIYPNPVQDQLNTTLNSFVGATFSASVLSEDGKVVFKKNGLTVSGNSMSINASALSTGSYILELRNANGDKFIQKFIKE